VTSPLKFSVALAATLVTGGCATKKHVREAIAPVQQQVNDVQKQTNDNKTAIGDLDRQVASADEKATDAGKRAGQAMDSATAANTAAGQAGQKADSANSLAQQAQSGVSRVDTKLDRSLQNLDNYRLADTKQVYFKTGRSNIDQEAQAQLDAAVQALGNMHTYVIEIEGFADRTGNKAMNLELSRKRADAVVHYLTVDHNVPLRDVRELGIGSDFPNAVNKTRKDRQENRRVDVKIYVLDINGQGQNSADRATQSQ
jgi:outer membrane protein OmpA-like peptidoglycan-associated protein